MNDLILKIEQWANDRNLIDGCTPLDQSMKLFSEFGELADAVGKNDLEGIKDGIGDVFVVLTIMCRQSDYSITIEHGVRHIPSHYEVKERVIHIPSHYEVKERVKMCLIDIIDWVHISNYENSQNLQRVIQFLANIADHYYLTLQECVEHSYNEIKDRKGVMYNGQFVKSTDSQYESILEKLKSNPQI